MYLKFQNSILRQISSDIEEVAGPWHVFIRLFAAVGRSAAFLRVGPRPARVDRLKADGEHLVSPFYLTMYLCAYSQTTRYTCNNNNNNFESNSHAFSFHYSRFLLFSSLFFSFLFFPPGRERSLKIFEHLRQYLVTRTCSERNEDSNFLGSDREIVGGRSRGGKRNTRTKGTTSPRMMKIESNGCRVASRRCVDEEIEKLDCWRATSVILQGYRGHFGDPRERALLIAFILAPLLRACSNV